MENVAPKGGVWARPGPGAGPPAQVRPAGACPARRRRSGPPGPPGPPAQIRPTGPGAGPPAQVRPTGQVPRPLFS